jgi:hypothetical protein
MFNALNTKACYCIVPKHFYLSSATNFGTQYQLLSFLLQEMQQKTDYDPSDPNYCVWMPPEGQKGDGRTKLNEKYGY